MSRSPLGIVFRFLLALTGILLLGLSAPHDAPWQMRYLYTDASDPAQVRLTLLSAPIVVSVHGLITMVAVVLAGLTLLTPGGRRSLITVFRQPAHLSRLLLVAGYLAFTHPHPALTADARCAGRKTPVVSRPRFVKSYLTS